MRGRRCWILACGLIWADFAFFGDVEADEVRGLMRKAQGLSDAAQYEHALPAWQAVLAERPDETHALVEAGISASMLGQYRLACQYLERAREIGRATGARPDPRILLNLGLVYLRQHRMAEAEEMFRKTLETDPSYRDANLHLGIIAEERGNFALAREYYIKEVNIVGGSNAAWARLFALQSRNQGPRGGLSGAFIFLGVCLAAAGVMMAVHWLRKKAAGRKTATIP